MKKTRKQTEETDHLDPQELIRVWGWNSVDELANEVYCSIHRELLSGNLIFAVRNPRIIITQRVDNGLYMLGSIFPGYTQFVPNAPLEYIRKEVLEDLEANKVGKEIIRHFNFIFKENEK